MLRTMHGRIKAIDNRTNSRGNTPSMEMTKQEKKRQRELEQRMPHGGTCKQPHTGSQIARPTPEPTRFVGAPIPSRFSEWTQVHKPECPTHATIVLPSQAN